MKPHNAFIASFSFAGRGIWQTLRHQRNFRVHVSVALAVSSLAWVLNFSRIDWGLLVLAMALVLGLELVNTGIEAIVDLVSPGFNRLAGAAKDAAAGAVLIAAAASVALGLVVYGPRLEHFGSDFMVRWHQSPTALVAWCIGLAVCYTLLWGFVPGRRQHEGGQNRIGGTS